jgi:hypothetical protein
MSSARGRGLKSMRLQDANTPTRSQSRGDGGAEQYGALLDLLLSDPAVAAWLEPDDDLYAWGMPHDESSSA